MRVGLLLILLFAVPAAAGTLDVSLNDESARGAFGWQVTEEHLVADVSWFHQEDDQNLVGLGLHAAGEATFGNGVYGGVGLNAVYGDDDVHDGWGIGLGGFFRWGFTRSGRVGLLVDLHHAPEMFSGGDLEGYTEFSAGIGYRILTTAEVHVGYRHIELEPENGSDAELSEDLMFGFTLRWGRDSER
jgi:hypothetical protein